MTIAENSVLEKICERCFMKSGLQEITLPASVKEVETAAFFRCPSLRTIYTRGDPSLCDGAFAGNKIVVKHLNREKLGNALVQDLRRLRDVTVPSVETIEKNAFRSSDVESVVIPACVRIIEDDAFSQCSKLKKVTFASGSKLERVGVCAFAQSGIEVFTAPESLLELGRGAFRGCERLRRVELAEGLATLGAEAFSGCKVLGKVVFPASLREVGDSAFAGCGRLRSVVLNEGLEKIDECAFQSTALSKISIPGSVGELRGTFIYCKSLKSVQLVSGLRTIGENCFRGSGLRRITIPASVSEIGDSAFEGCRDLRVVEFAPGSELKQVGPLAFRGTQVSKQTVFPAGATVAEDAFE